MWEKLNEIISSQQANSLTNRFENSFFSVNLEYATYIERNDDNYHSYTFCVLSDQDSIYNINNLVLSTTDNRIYEADIVTYELTENDYVQLLTESGSSINFDNKIFIQSFDIAQVNITNWGGTCYELIDTGEEEFCSHSDHQSSHEQTGRCTHPSKIFEWQEVDCGGGSGGSVSGGDTGSSTGGGSGSGSTSGGNGITKATLLKGIDDGPRKNPCERLKTLTKTDSLSANIKPIVDSLRNKTNLNKEYSIGIQKKRNYGKFYTYPSPEGIIEGISKTRSKCNTGTRYVGQIHTHPNGTFPIFSWLDVQAISKLYDGATMDFKDDIFLMIVNHNGTVYSLVINNVGNLTSSLQEDLDNAEGNNIDEKVKFIEEELRNLYTNSINLEKTFLELFGDYGIALYKATDSNLSNWEELKLDDTNNNEVIKNPCG